MANEPGLGVQTVTEDGRSLSDEILDALEALPEGRRREMTAILVSQEYHSGPLPSLSTFAGYEVVLPGSAREIMDMAVLQ